MDIFRRASSLLYDVGRASPVSGFFSSISKTSSCSWAISDSDAEGHVPTVWHARLKPGPKALPVIGLSGFSGHHSLLRPPLSRATSANRLADGPGRKRDVFGGYAHIVVVLRKAAKRIRLFFQPWSVQYPFCQVNHSQFG